ncbi:hypothetical protein FPY71_07070 [Aureimonas fodinaquatilis]|uniref:Uncharacterized protein n=1 Tax=Aureimonas fodinaquatilis TaxID=2565783 RepID=A0A5B0DXK4_9HYPH|nr:hypothetical protein [Aureimonas fodinaquatilis]KAA0970280.1 hypothetical protein FPY71_07070 [Aureimonas fodinaquatilis]
MTQAKHTPGPWSVFIDDSGGQWTGWPLSISAVNETDKTVVRTGGQWPYEWDNATSQREAVANAQLIAAAPDLLEVLKRIDSVMDFSGTQYSQFDGLQEQMLAAIAKAEGRS